MSRDFSAAFRGIAEPIRQLYNEIGRYGWSVQSVDKKDGRYICRVSNPHNESIERFGPDPATAVGAALMYIMRKEYGRTAAQIKLGMWDHDWTDQLEPIAQAYRDAPVYDPKAAHAWKELADDSVARAKILAQQLDIEVVDDPEPYANAKEMCDDVHNNKHFLVSRANSDHPMWTTDQNVAFRIVHDIMGHCVSGGDFGWAGENKACRAHFPLLSPNAQQALFTECIAQTGYGAHYRGFGPQKVALMPQFVNPAQAKENQPGHMGVHPSQSLAPIAMPSVPKSFGVGLDRSTIAPHQEGLGLTPAMNPGQAQQTNQNPYFGKTAQTIADPNHGWSSGITPDENSAYLNGDPLEWQGVMDNAKKIDTNWSKLTKPDGTPDIDRMKLAIVNAFRVVLLSPRKDLRWNAVHYQDISHIPASVNDPKVYWDALEEKRKYWNVARGRHPEAHLIYFKPRLRFYQLIAAQHPELDHDQAKAKADEMIWHMHQDEVRRIEQDDADKPEGKQRAADEIDRRANEAIAKRLTEMVKDYDPKTDVADDQMSMFGAKGQQDIFTGEDAEFYGAFMGTHLKAIAQISQHADEILQAALEDVRAHDGSGHHFRAKVLALNVPGVGPKVCSFAWLLLQPMTSQLGTIDTHMMDVLGHNYEKEMNNRDYFKFERELQAGRDAAGYSHIPLGAFQWGMWDFKRTGPGSHQDHSAMKVLDPMPHNDIDWVGKAQNLKGESWAKQAPDWWQQTQDARDAVAEDFNNTVAPTTPQGQIPFKQASAPKTSITYKRPWFRHPETLDVHYGQPGQTLMHHIVTTTGWRTPDVWKQILETGKD